MAPRKEQPPGPDGASGGNEGADGRGSHSESITAGGPPEGEVDEWPPLVPLDSEHDLPAYPTDALPGWLAEYVSAVATAYQVPPDLPGSLALATLATAAAKRIEIEAGDDWLEPANLYVVTALGPGNRKTGAAREMFRPLHTVERDLAAEWRSRVRDRAAERRVLEARQAKAEKQASTNEDPNERAAKLDEAQRLAEELEAAPELHLPRLLTDDTTPEACARLMHAQGGRIAVLSGETDLFEVLGGRYTGGTPTVGVFLSGHAGDPLQVDRVNREPIVIQSPSITLGVATQPHVLERIGATPTFRERGLTQRILYALPRSPLGARDVSPPPVPQSLRATYDERIGALVRDLGLPTDDEGSLRLRLDSGARDRLTTYRAELEPRLASDGDLVHIAGWVSKLPGAIVRIAGLIHVASNSVHSVRSVQGGAAVSRPTVEAAIRLGDYYLAHAVAALDLAGADPALADARAVWGWICRRRLEVVTDRDVLRESPVGRDKGRRDGALEELVERGYLREMQPPSGPGRKARRYAVRPMDSGQIGHNGQNHPTDSGSVHSGHSVQGAERENDTGGAAEYEEELI